LPNIRFTERRIRGRARGALTAVVDGLKNKANEWALCPHEFKEGVGLGVEETDTDALAEVLQTADGSGREVYLIGGSIGELKIGETISLADGDFSIRGAHRHFSCLRATMTGQPLFKMAAGGSLLRFHMEDVRLQGNGLTGASGSGHAIQMFDPDPTSGTHLPQMVTLSRVTIDGFRGTGAANYAESATHEACGIIQIGGLGCVTREVAVSNCGRGIVRQQTQNCRDIDPIISLCDKVGVLSYKNENYILDGADVIQCGDGVDMTIPDTIKTGNIVSYQDECPQFPFLKSKNSGGFAQVIIVLSEQARVEGFWIQPSMTADVAHRGIYIERAPGTKVKDGFFHLTNTSFEQDYEVIEAVASQSAEPLSGLEIVGNRFGFAPGMNVAYFIKVRGTAAGRPVTGLSIRNNVTQRAAPSSACTVDDGILLSSIALTDSEISENSIRAPSNVTITRGITGSSISQTRAYVRSNSFRADSGTITNNYSGITPDDPA
jgi:hypothetical protein